VKKITISLLSLAFLIGCGSSSSDDTTKDDKTLDFNRTNAKYDLNDYLQINSVVTYKLSSYTNNSGEKKYEEDDKKEAFPSQTSRHKENVIVMTNAQNIETGTIKILTNKLERTAKIGDKSIKFDVVRNFNIDDYITNSNMNQKISNATLELNRACKTTNILESKEYSGVTYKDVLEIKCSTTSKLTSKNDLTPKADVEKSELIYLAKEKGIIYTKSETCTSVTNIIIEDEKEVKVCKKEIKEIISFNKI